MLVGLELRWYRCVEEAEQEEQADGRGRARKKYELPLLGALAADGRAPPCSLGEAGTKRSADVPVLPGWLADEPVDEAAGEPTNEPADESGRALDAYWSGAAAVALADLSDLDPNCASWAASGECSTNARYMGHACAASCSKLQGHAPRDVRSVVAVLRASWCHDLMFTPTTTSDGRVITPLAV